MFGTIFNKLINIRIKFQINESKKGWYLIISNNDLDQKRIKFIVKNLEKEVKVVSDLYFKSLELYNRGESIVIQKLIQVTALLKIVSDLSNLKYNSSIDDISYMVDSLGLSLLVSAVEAIGTSENYQTSQEWFNKVFLKKDKTYSKNDINRAFEEYNLEYGSGKTFRNVILDSGLSDLLHDFYFKEFIMLLPNNATAIIHKRIEVKNIANPHSLVNKPISLYNEDKEYILLKNRAKSEIIVINRKENDRRILSDFDELDEYYINIDDIQRYGRGEIRLKEPFLKKEMRIQLSFLYDLRSRYYHSAWQVFNSNPDFIQHRDWKS